MKTIPFALIAAVLLPIITGHARAQNAPPEEDSQPPVAAEQAEPTNQPPEQEQAEPAEGLQQRPDAPQNTSTGEPGELRLNFRNAPLDVVLNYLSQAAGFTIVLETQVKGTIDVWSNRPVTTKEALDILDGALSKNGYAAIRNGKTLTIVSREAATTRNIPIIQSTSWESIPMTDVVATYIIPVRYINADQLKTTLEPLTPKEMQIAANADSNSLLITDSQAAIRRIVHIVSLLDSSVSSVSTMKVITLKHADAKSMAQTINDLYSSSNNSNNRNTRGNFGRGGFPFRRPGGNNPPD